MKKTILFAIAASFTLAVPAQAHRAWLLPSTTVLSDTTQGVTVDAAMSTDPFNADHAAMRVDDIKVWAPDGSIGTVENAARGRYRTTFDVMIDKPGTWRIGTDTNALSGTFTVGGEEWRVGRGRPGRGGNAVATVDEIPATATNVTLTQTFSRNEFFVTAGEPTEGAFTPSNTGLEMVPVTYPTDLVSSEPGRFRFLIDGKPAAGLAVTVVPGGQRFRDAEHGQELTTDADGVLTVSWPVAGFYWINANAADDKPSDTRASGRRMSYTTTLEVAAP